jgi:acetyl/propionyl-CoA carboxylase alpha subunit
METRLRQGARTIGVALADDGDGQRAEIDGRVLHVRPLASHRVRTADGAEAAELLVAIDGRTSRAIVVRTGDKLLVSLDGRAHVFALGEESSRGGATGGTGITVAPMPGKIARVLVAAGDAVEPGDPLVVLEAMKMETTLRAEVAGTVAAIAVAEGAMVEAGTVLVEITPPA